MDHSSEVILTLGYNDMKLIFIAIPPRHLYWSLLKAYLEVNVCCMFVRSVVKFFIILNN